jgi:hypothetical protein
LCFDGFGLGNRSFFGGFFESFSYKAKGTFHIKWRGWVELKSFSRALKAPLLFKIKTYPK